jgi:hypothetical protein
MSISGFDTRLRLAVSRSTLPVEIRGNALGRYASSAPLPPEQKGA